MKWLGPWCKVVANTPGGCGAFQRDSTGWINWPTWASWCSVRRSAKSCMWRGITQCTNTGWSLASWISALQKRIQGILVDPQLLMNQQWTHKAKKVNSILGCTRESITGRPRDMILLLYSVLVRPIWSAGSGSGLPRTRDEWTFWNRFIREPQRWWGIGAFLLWGEAGRAVTVHSRVKKAQRNLINLDKYLKGGKTEPDPSQWYPRAGPEKRGTNRNTGNSI